MDTQILTGKKVYDIFIECLFNGAENTSNAVQADGVMAKIGFNPERLEANKEKIKALLDELPDEFKQSGGGGWSFLNMCMDKHGNQWTGFHMVQDQLIMLGLAIGYVVYSVPREFWPVLPGGVPYIMVKDGPKGN